MVVCVPGANVEAALSESWINIGYGETFPSADGLFSSGIAPGKFIALLMDECRRISPGPTPMPV